MDPFFSLSTPTNNRSPRNASNNYKSMIIETVITSAVAFGMYMLIKPFVESQLSDLMDPHRGERKAMKGNAKRLQGIMDRRAEIERKQDAENEGDNGGKNPTSADVNSQSAEAATPPLVLNPYELQIAEGVVDPNDMLVTFKDIGGIDHSKGEIYDLVVMPLKFPHLYKSGGVESPKGILLYGAPGTGKTMLAKAIAKEGEAAFVNVKLSSIMNKYFGESQKMVAAVFSLARKLAPSVIFIDEIDTFLRQRDGESGDSSLSSMKSEFLTLWDGILSEKNGDVKPVVVLGATNRPYDVDTAILRRLPRTFEIGLPDEKSRCEILKLQISRNRLTEAAANSLSELAKITKGFSGSDLKELTRAASMEPIREITEKYSKQAVSAADGKNNAKASTAVKIPKGTVPRKIDVKDFHAALKKVQRTGAAAESFREKEQKAGIKRDGGGVLSSKDIQVLSALLYQNIQQQQQPQGAWDNGNNTGHRVNNDKNNKGIEILD